MNQTTYDSYSVGCFTESGKTVSGGTHRTEADARRAFDHFRSLPQMASVTLFGWNGEECEELDGWGA